MSDADTQAEERGEEELRASRRYLLAADFHERLIAYYATCNAALIAKDRGVCDLIPALMAKTAVDHADALLDALEEGSQTVA
jgi:phage-related minor tail protein